MIPQKRFPWVGLAACLIFTLGSAASAQVSSGSNGSDGAFNPTTNTVINMADHPDGIYQYTEANVPNGVTVRFIPNAANTPVVWLVQSNCTISGRIYLAGQLPDLNGLSRRGIGGDPGPGGYRGGDSGASASA